MLKKSGGFWGIAPESAAAGSRVMAEQSGLYRKKTEKSE